MKKKTPKPKKTGRVTSIAVSRLYNTGNYTNLRYDLSAEVPKGASPSETLRRLVNTLAALAPICRPSCLPNLREARKKKLSERNEYEKNNYPEWLEAERRYKDDIEARNQAVEDLDRMGGTSTSRDAKDSWDSDDVPW